MLRVHGLPATLTAFITSMAVLFQSVMTSARASVVLEISAKPRIAVLSARIIASIFRASQNLWTGHPGFLDDRRVQLRAAWSSSRMRPDHQRLRWRGLLEPIREVWIHDEAFAASRLSM